MVEWDYCRVVLAPEGSIADYRQAMNEYKRWARHRLIFSSPKPIFKVWWEAKLETARASVIDKSPAFDVDDRVRESGLRSSLVIRLIQAGWQPVPGSMPGRVERLRRRLPAA